MKPTNYRLNQPVPVGSLSWPNVSFRQFNPARAGVAPNYTGGVPDWAGARAAAPFIKAANTYVDQQREIARWEERQAKAAAQNANTQAPAGGNPSSPTPTPPAGGGGNPPTPPPTPPSGGGGGGGGGGGNTPPPNTTPPLWIPPSANVNPPPTPPATGGPPPTTGPPPAAGPSPAGGTIPPWKRGSKVRGYQKPSRIPNIPYPTARGYGGLPAGANLQTKFNALKPIPPAPWNPSNMMGLPKSAWIRGGPLAGSPGIQLPVKMDRRSTPASTARKYRDAAEEYRPTEWDKFSQQVRKNP